MFANLRSGNCGVNGNPIIAFNGILLVSVLAVGLSACGNTQTYTVGDGKGQMTVTSDNSGNATVKVNSGDGTMANMAVGGTATYPSEIPFPQYPSSKITFSMKTTDKNTSNTVTLETQDTTDKAMGFYRSWFNSNGWTIELETNTSGAGSMTAKKGEQTAAVMFMPQSPPASGIAIQIMLSADK
ncbi:MAG: hypothetical protein K2X29_07960 [Candidatus Obscuribacterales bacterium]|nr:hypothetical protein [Candidatus Obscuribacterales bacterium]